MEQGWVYVLVNSSIPGLVKVGRTARAPAERAAELSGVSGVATPFIVAYEQYFSDCHAAERHVHAELERRGWRVATNREFFRGSPSDIIKVVLEAVDAVEPFSGAGGRPRQAETAAALLEAGDRAWFGHNDTLQDTGEAIRCYKLAMARGSAMACERLGDIFLRLHAERPDHISRRRAMAPLKEGARRGNPYCYVGMAWLFAAEKERDSFEKAWRMFFANARVDVSAGPGSSRYAAACSRYIDWCLEAQMEPAHRAELRGVSDLIVAHLLAELERVRDDAEERRRVAAQLRWAYGALLSEPSALPAPRARKAARGWLAWTDVAPA